MKKTSYTIKTMTASLALALILPGCADRLEPSRTGDTVITIEAALGSTRATLINGVDGLGAFKCSAYRQDGTAVFEDKTVTKTDSRWVIQSDRRYWWKSGETLTFYAVYPQDQSGVVISKDGIAISNYTVPAVAQQKDILLGSYSGTGNAGVAPVTFVHALTALTVTKGDIESTIPGFTKVNSITVDGLYAGGSVSGWSGGSAVSWTGTGSKSFTPAFGDVLTLVPQNLATKSVTVTVAYSAASGDGTITATISSGVFAAGSKNNITVNYKSVEVTYDGSSITVPAYGAGTSYEGDSSDTDTPWS